MKTGRVENRRKKVQTGGNRLDCFTAAVTTYTFTVVPTKSDSDVLFCLQFLTKTLT